MPKARELYTVKELGDMAGLSRGQIERLIVRREIQVEYVGRRKYIPFCEILEKVAFIWDSARLADMYNEALAD